MRVHFENVEGVVKAVDGVSFSLEKGTVLGIVGQSGSGKTVAASSILGMVNRPGKIVEGEIYLRGRDLLRLSIGEIRRIRGKGVFMIFQSPASALNPTLKVGTQIAEVMVRHNGLSWRRARVKAAEFLEAVGIGHSHMQSYPFELSGGMQQRVLIAAALALEPDVLIADEPTTGLDTITQMEILKLLKDLKVKLASSIILITHDLRVVAHIADQVAVMYKGRIVDSGPVADIFRWAKHPHTKELIETFLEIEQWQKRNTC